MRSSILNKILLDWRESVKSGVPDTTDATHLSKLFEILGQHGWPGEARMEFIGNIVEQKKKTIDPETPVKYTIKDKDGKDIQKTTTYGQAIKRHTDSPAFKAADALRQKGAGEEPEKPRKGLKPSDFERDFDKKEPSNEPISGINDIQSDLENKRDKGEAGAGGATASQGESRYCNAMNNHDDENFKKENREAIDKKKKEIKIQAKEKEILDALGLDYDSDEALEYLATREVFAEQELERIKQDKDSVFYKKGKKGFGENDEAYLEWMRAAYDGTLSTRKILDEDTDMDMSKPNTTVQSTKELDDKIEADLKQRANDPNLSDEDREYYQKELKDFQKFRKYHDTYTIGQDKNGRLHIVSISNKKGSDLKDPQNNTTPKARFEVIKDNYGDDVAERVINSLNEGIERVSDTKQSTVKRGSKIEITDSISSICETKEMKKYIDKLDENKKFREFVEKQGKDYDKLSIKEKLQLMQQHADELIDNGKKPAYEPYGKIWTKIGEFSRTKKFQKNHPDINFDDESVNTSIQIKQDEKYVVNSAHANVVNEVTKADEDEGFPKDGVNGPHTQGYISTVMKAMHFDTYIDGGDKKMIIQMGIRGGKPSHIRRCLAEQSGFEGDVKSKEGREALKKHLREKCRIDAESGAIFVKSPDGERQIAEDTWRTAGTSQKVASGFGEEMRNCIKSKVDSDREK